MATPETNNYLATNFFELKIERIPSVVYFCQSVNLPSLTIAPIEIPIAERGIPLRNPVGRYSYENMSVSFLVDEKMDNWISVYNWLYSLSTPENVPGTYAGRSGIFSDATLLIKNSSYNTVKEIYIKDIFPVGISGIQFSTVVVDTEPVIATATFAFTTYEICDPNAPDGTMGACCVDGECSQTTRSNCDEQEDSRWTLGGDCEEEGICDEG